MKPKAHALSDKGTHGLFVCGYRRFNGRGWIILLTSWRYSDKMPLMIEYQAFRQ